MPRFNAILETVLYVDDMDRAATFYEDVLQLPAMLKTDRLCAYNVNDAGVLLLFLRGGTLEPVVTEHAYIPPHDGHGPLHMAFSCDHATLPEWKRHLTDRDIAIEGTADWPRGGKSIYFRDPDSNLLEIAATPGLWPGF